MPLSASPPMTTASVGRNSSRSTTASSPAAAIRGREAVRRQASNQPSPANFAYLYGPGARRRSKFARVGAGPLQQAVGVPRVHDAVEGDFALGGALAAVGLPLELAGSVGIRVDRELATRVDRGAQQLARRVEAFGPAVDLDRGVELRA